MPRTPGARSQRQRECAVPIVQCLLAANAQERGRFIRQVESLPTGRSVAEIRLPDRLWSAMLRRAREPGSGLESPGIMYYGGLREPRNPRLTWCGAGVASLRAFDVFTRASSCRG